MKTVLDSGDLRICYPSNRMWTINADAVTKVCTKYIVLVSVELFHFSCTIWFHKTAPMGGALCQRERLVLFQVFPHLANKSSYI